MANTIAKATGVDANRTKETHRLGSKYAQAEANTWKTFTTVRTYADGSGWFEVRQNGVKIHEFAWGAENAS
jgi:hypothetical protein